MIGVDQRAVQDYVERSFIWISRTTQGMAKPQDRTARTRHRIERAALEQFVEKGIAATSIRDIARTAQVSLGAMYNHFESKEDLAWNLFITAWVEMGRELRECAKGEESLDGKFRVMIRYLFQRFDDDWLLVTYCYISRHQHLLKRTQAMRDNPYVIFRRVVSVAMRRGEIPKADVELATSLVMGAIVQATDSRILERLKGPLVRYANRTAAMCAEMLKAAV